MRSLSYQKARAVPGLPKGQVVPQRETPTTAPVAVQAPKSHGSDSKPAWRRTPYAATKKTSHATSSQTA